MADLLEAVDEITQSVGQSPTEAHDLLEEIQDAMQQLAEHALKITKAHCKNHVYERARAYWYPHIIMGLSEDHDYLGRDGATMQEVIDVLGGEEDDDDETDS